MNGRLKDHEFATSKRVEAAEEDIAHARKSGLAHIEINTAFDMQTAYSTLKRETARLSLSLCETLSDLPEDILEHSDIIPVNSFPRKLERVVLIAGSFACRIL